MSRAGRPWRWVTRETLVDLRPSMVVLVDGRGRDRATIWKNDEHRFTWHTWDDCGTGGENSEARSLNAAKDEAIAALVRQGWAPGGWKVRWA